MPEFIGSISILSFMVGINMACLFISNNRLTISINLLALIVNLMVINQLMNKAVEVACR